ncbi:Ribonuclease E [compost metagenome]
MEAVVAAPAEATVTTEPEVVSAQPEAAPAPVQAAPVVAQPQPVLYKHIATAPMTKAPAPDYQPEAAKTSEWQRPSFNFDGKGSAGGHAAANQATAPATKPQPVND